MLSPPPLEPTAPTAITVLRRPRRPLGLDVSSTPPHVTPAAVVPACGPISSSLNAPPTVKAADICTMAPVVAGRALLPPPAPVAVALLPVPAPVPGDAPLSETLGRCVTRAALPVLTGGVMLRGAGREAVASGCGTPLTWVWRCSCGSEVLGDGVSHVLLPPPWLVRMASRGCSCCRWLVESDGASTRGAERRMLPLVAPPLPVPLGESKVLRVGVPRG